ncbi:unnamed protein product [Brassicogethes aeneus]|uniref:Cyclic nucleotide-binding domain-containing protein n=1 Tax=Brassicogethes aeneus TaxID=1431903 RepID=A0A9P0AQ01_BRAAE|nr:unnamed protein product [Brassicogethes aeneus]
MHNICTLPPKDFPAKKGKWDLVFQFTTLSADHVRCMEYFMGYEAIYNEKLTHYNSNYWYIIHPLSRFRYFYDTYAFFWFSVSFIVKPFHLALNTPNNPYYFIWLLYWIDNFLTYVDIILNFFSGYISNGRIHLKHNEVFLNYIKLHFICDALCAAPTLLFCDLHGCQPWVYGLVGLLSCSRLIKLHPVLKYVDRYASQRRIALRWIIMPIYLFLILKHWAVCVQLMLPNFRRNEYGEYDRKSWIMINNVFNLTTAGKYRSTFLRISSMFLAVNIYNNYYMWVHEEFCFTLFLYVLGYLLIAIYTILVLLYVGNRFQVDKKYVEVLEQLEHYMHNKQLPQELRAKLRSCYSYKFQSKFYNEMKIKTLLSENLNKQLSVYSYKNLISKTPILALLSIEDACRFIEFCKSDVYFPNDVVIQSEQVGTTFYILAHGTVSVCTSSGIELCHLDEGSYFGEIALMSKSQKRTATVIALEISEIYYLDKVYFYGFLKKYPEFAKRIRTDAAAKLDISRRVEQMNKDFLFRKELKF